MYTHRLLHKIVVKHPGLDGDEARLDVRAAEAGAPMAKSFFHSRHVGHWRNGLASYSSLALRSASMRSAVSSRDIFSAHVTTPLYAWKWKQWVSLVPGMVK